MGNRSGPAADDFAAKPSGAGPADGADRDPAHLPGRERALADVRQRLFASEGPNLLVVEGERGVGRSTFVHALATGARADEREVSFLVCDPEDGRRPLLLALRLVKALAPHRQSPPRPRRADGGAADALAAVERGEPAAMGRALVAALAQSAPLTLVVDDAHHADTESLDLLGGVDLERVAPDVRLVLSVLRHRGAGRHTPGGGPSGGVERLANRRGAHRTVLPRLERAEVAAVVSRRLHAVADPELVCEAHDMSGGVPAAVDVLLTAWSRNGATRTVDDRVLLCPGTPPPVLPDEDRFVAALRALGEPSRTVAAALSVLWPLGRAAATHVAEATGLSAALVDDGLGALIAAGIVGELPGPEGAPPRGWAFSVPLLEHTVRRRLGPLERNRLSVAAVAAVRDAAAARRAGTQEAGTQGAAAELLAEADPDTYLPDRLAEVDFGLDRRRVVAELAAAADRLHPDPGRRGMLRWLRTAVRFAEEPEVRDDLIRRYVGMAYTAGEYEAARRAAASVLRDPAGFGLVALQEAAALLVGSAAAVGDRIWLDRLASGRWWRMQGLPPAVEVTGRALALCGQGRWTQALALLRQTGREEDDARAAQGDEARAARVFPALFRAVAELVCGEPERFVRSLTLPDMNELPRYGRYAVTVIQVDQLLGAGDLREAGAVLARRGITEKALPAYSLFLWHHLEGRWDDALAVARRALVSGQVDMPTPGHHLLPERMSAVLLARGRTRSAQYFLDEARGRATGPSESLLDRAEAELARTLGDLSGAEQTLRRGLKAAEAGGYVYGTDELWAALVQVCLDTGQVSAAAECVRELERVAQRTGQGRAHLLHLRAAAQLPGQDATVVQDLLREAVGLARSRSQPFETAETLLAAASASGGPAPWLYEAYQLFGDVGASLWRFRTRAAIRESRHPVPGRKQATAENEQLLAVLVAEGLSNRQIAAVLGLSEDAVANRLTRLFARVGVRSRAEVVAAVRTGHPLGTPER
ncbi:LuxR family transcriptional regulator [Streptomyces lydicus]|uniref:AAA family ATPase n=1 Tax=Streptomyces lydicus TaxID=47763 RepID=UPI001012859E|nr:LuxR family transcriptional regulator [Streptomyces lydicus]